MKPWNMQNLLRKNRNVWVESEFLYGRLIRGAKLVSNSHQSSNWWGLLTNDCWMLKNKGDKDTDWELYVRHGHMHGQRLSIDLVRVL